MKYLWEIVRSWLQSKKKWGALREHAALLAFCLFLYISYKWITYCVRYPRSRTSQSCLPFYCLSVRFQSPMKNEFLSRGDLITVTYITLVSSSIKSRAIIHVLWQGLVYSSLLVFICSSDKNRPIELQGQQN